MLALAILVGCSFIAISILVLCALVSRVSDHFDGVANMFFAVRTMQLRLELDECGYECPDWLKIMDEDEQPLDMEPPTELRLVKLEKDKQGE